MRLIMAAVLALSAGLYVAYAKFVRTETAVAEDQGEKLKGLKKTFGEELDKLVDRFQKAATAPEKRGVQTEARELAALTAGKVAKIAEADPKAETALEAAEFTLTRLVPIGASGPDVDKVITIAAEHHINSPKVKDLVLISGQLGSAGEKLLRAAAERSTDKEVKGIALYSLGTMLAEQASDATTEKTASELTAKAIQYLEQAAKEAPDVKMGDQTIAAQAKDEIAALKTLSIGSPAPNIEGKTLDGKSVKLSDYKGKVVLLDIWATWCGPCRAMIPHERQMVEKLKGKPFELISVSADEEKETLTKFLEKEKMPWTHWWVGEGSDALKTLRIKAFPTLFLIDSKGVIRKKWIGVPGGDPESRIVEEAVEELLKEVGKG